MNITKDHKLTDEIIHDLERWFSSNGNHETILIDDDPPVEISIKGGLYYEVITTEFGKTNPAKLHLYFLRKIGDLHSFHTSNGALENTFDEVDIKLAIEALKTS